MSRVFQFFFVSFPFGGRSAHPARFLELQPESSVSIPSLNILRSFSYLCPSSIDKLVRSVSEICWSAVWPGEHVFECTWCVRTIHSWHFYQSEGKAATRFLANEIMVLHKLLISHSIVKELIHMFCGAYLVIFQTVNRETNVTNGTETF